MVFLTQKSNTEIFGFIAILVFNSLSDRVLFINRNDKRNCQKVGYFLRE